MGRTPVATDLEGVRLSLESHRVLVTGAGGSIGSEICRQVAGFAPAQLILLDHDETHLHDTASVLDGPCHQALVDINDRETLFERVRALPTRRRPPHCRPQARSCTRGPPGRGRSHQRVRHAQRDRGICRSRGHPVLADLIRQGGAALECHGRVEARGRTTAVESRLRRTASTVPSGSAMSSAAGAASFPHSPARSSLVVRSP